MMCIYIYIYKDLKEHLVQTTFLQRCRPPELWTDIAMASIALLLQPLETPPCLNPLAGEQPAEGDGHEQNENSHAPNLKVEILRSTYRAGPAQQAVFIEATGTVVCFTSDRGSSNLGEVIAPRVIALQDSRHLWSLEKKKL